VETSSETPTVGCEVVGARDQPVHLVVGAHLLPEHGDARVDEERSVERVLAFPWC
jgi:hypothetical protein